MGTESIATPDAVTLAELLCARLCHDLSGAVGATAAGAELLQDLGGADAETVALVATSAGGAAARLRLLRAALGPAASAPQSLESLRAMVDAHLQSQVSAAVPATSVRWRDCPDQIDGDRARLLLNFVLLGRDALPRGGNLDVSLADGVPAVLARGEPASCSDEVREALTGTGGANGPRTAQALLTRMLAQKLNGRVMITPTAQGLLLSMEPIG